MADLAAGTSGGWAVVVGAQDPALVRALQPQLPRLLLVQANPCLAERLREDWPAGLPAGVCLREEPVGARAEPVTWYRYNDARLWQVGLDAVAEGVAHNGVVPP